MALRGRMGLDGGVLGEHVAGLGGHGQAELAGRHRLDAERRQQLPHLAQLAGIVGGDDDLAGQLTMHGCILGEECSGVLDGGSAQATVFFCRSTSCATPALARRRRLRNSSSENGLPSAVPWTSTMPPEPVMTKLASVSAAESSA